MSIEGPVDRYRIRCKPVRDLIVDYLRERQPSLDFAGLDAISRTLAGLIRARIESLAPGIDSLRLPPVAARAWKDDLKVKKRTAVGSDGKSAEVSSPRLDAKDEHMRVRAFYLDIPQWAAEEPARRGPWAVPCPISDDEIHKAEEFKRRKARMDQRTRERFPVLPILVSTTERRRREAAGLLQAAGDPGPGALIPATGGALRRAIAPKAAGHLSWVEVACGRGPWHPHPCVVIDELTKVGCRMALKQDRGPVQRSVYQTPFRTRSSAARPAGPQCGLPPGRP
ncbi:hypothetical protein ACF08M_13710 [Streptomyces sp. NPDC015032]|uniref:hypothetical protein n=1 Tax=Streptomyces sp. NPDC015032 TaxID=3364937 RepID=UPI0036FB6702